MILPEIITLYDDEDRELIVTGEYEFHDDETTEAGTTRLGGDVFYINKITRGGVDVINEFTAEQIRDMALECLERAREEE